MNAQNKATQMPGDAHTEFKHGFVQCNTCKAKYCSLNVYFITHAPPYEFRCPCGPEGLYLRWKVEKSQIPEALKMRWAQRLKQRVTQLIRG